MHLVSFATLFAGPLMVAAYGDEFFSEVPSYGLHARDPGFFNFNRGGTQKQEQEVAQKGVEELEKGEQAMKTQTKNKGKQAEGAADSPCRKMCIEKKSGRDKFLKETFAMWPFGSGKYPAGPRSVLKIVLRPNSNLGDRTKSKQASYRASQARLMECMNECPKA